MPGPAGAYRNRDYTVKIGDVEFSNQFMKARLTPTTTVATLVTLVPGGSVVDADDTTWTFDINGVEDWTTGGLARALWDARGTMVDVTLVPRNGSGKPNASFTMLATPMGIGGAQGNWNTGDYTFNVAGEPTIGEES